MFIYTHSHKYRQTDTHKLFALLSCYHIYYLHALAIGDDAVETTGGTTGKLHSYIQLTMHLMYFAWQV